MTRQNGAISLAYMRGERKINPHRTRKLKSVDMESLTPAQRYKVEEEARKTGECYQVVAARILAGQTKMEDY